MKTFTELSKVHLEILERKFFARCDICKELCGLLLKRAKLSAMNVQTVLLFVTFAAAKPLLRRTR